MPVSNQTIAEFLEALADRVPAPGGGATAALHVAQGAALVAMVARYSDGPKYDAQRDAITAAVRAADSIRAEALTLADDDEAAFSKVSAAYALPRGTDAEKERRRAAISAALAEAAEPPMGVVDAAERVVDLAVALMPIANRNLIGDLAAAAEAARAGAATGRINIEANMGGISDDAMLRRCAESTATVDDVQAAAEKVTAAVRAGLKR